MTKLTETQTNILTAGAQRPGNIAMPLPKRLDALLQRPEGASIAEIVAATGWMAHRAGGAISGVSKKKLGLPVTSGKFDRMGTVYKLDVA